MSATVVSPRKRLRLAQARIQERTAWVVASVLALERHGAAYPADLGSLTRGSDSLLEFTTLAVSRARLRADELVVATEASARTLAIRLGRACSIRCVADGPSTAHAEAHITFVPKR